MKVLAEMSSEHLERITFKGLGKFSFTVQEHMSKINMWYGMKA